MQFNESTGYAVRMVIFLAENRGFSGGEELRAGTAIPATVLPAITKPLRRAGIIATRRGNQGGFTLAKSPEQITMADIVRAMEGTTRINRCLEADSHCALGRASTCKVRAFYLEVQEWLDKTFEAKTVASLMSEKEFGDKPF